MDQQTTPLRDVAENSDAYVRYLQDVQRVVLDLEHSLAILVRKNRVHCRGIHVEGDRLGSAYLRSRPAERALEKALKDLSRTASDLEKAAVRRREYDDKVKAVAEQRRLKALAKTNAAPQLQSVPDHTPPTTGSGPAPTSLYDLGKDRTA